MATHFVYFVKLAAHKAKNPSEYVHTNDDTLTRGSVIHLPCLATTMLYLFVGGRLILQK